MNSLHKIVRIEDAVKIADRHKQAGEPVVFTNGVFDLLHVGHLSILERAAQRGFVFVGVNSDASVRQLKGPTRPINTEEDRRRLLAALEPVHIVFSVESTDMAAAILAISPDYWVKSDEYTMETLHPKEVMAAKTVGAEILLLCHVLGYSTTLTINKNQST